MITPFGDSKKIMVDAQVPRSASGIRSGDDDQDVDRCRVVEGSSRPICCAEEYTGRCQANQDWMPHAEAREQPDDGWGLVGELPSELRGRLSVTLALN